MKCLATLFRCSFHQAFDIKVKVSLDVVATPKDDFICRSGNPVKFNFIGRCGNPVKILVRRRWLSDSSRSRFPKDLEVLGRRRRSPPGCSCPPPRTSGASQSPPATQCPSAGTRWPGRWRWRWSGSSSLTIGIGIVAYCSAFLESGIFSSSQWTDWPDNPDWECCCNLNPEIREREIVNKDITVKAA